MDVARIATIGAGIGLAVGVAAGFAAHRPEDPADRRGMTTPEFVLSLAVPVFAAGIGALGASFGGAVTSSFSPRIGQIVGGPGAAIAASVFGATALGAYVTSSIRD